MMHAALLENSPRLQRLFAILVDGEYHSTFELMRDTLSCAIHSDISELRAQGYDIHCLACGMNENRRRIFKYRLRDKEPKQQTELALNVR